MLHPRTLALRADASIALSCAFGAAVLAPAALAAAGTNWSAAKCQAFYTTWYHAHVPARHATVKQLNAAVSEEKLLVRQHHCVFGG